MTPHGTSTKICSLGSSVVKNFTVNHAITITPLLLFGHNSFQDLPPTLLRFFDASTFQSPTRINQFDTCQDACFSECTTTTSSAASKPTLSDRTHPSTKTFPPEPVHARILPHTYKHTTKPDRLTTTYPHMHQLANSVSLKRVKRNHTLDVGAASS